jgi:outer membrane protein assembly factor BamB
MPKEKMRPGLACAAVWAAVAAGVVAGDWPQALGPDRNGIVSGETVVPPAPGQKPRVLWQANAGAGWAPPVVVADRVYVYGVFRAGTTPDAFADPTTTPTVTEVREVAGVKEPEFRSCDLPGTPGFAREDSHGIFRGDGYVQCLDAGSGRRLWATRLTDWGVVLWGNWRAGERASPAVADGRLFIHTLSGRLYALEAATGRVAWEVNLFDHAMLRWDEKNGNACSPLVVGDTVLVSYLAGELEDYGKWQNTVTAVAGFDVASGRRRWLTKSPNRTFRSMSSDLGFAELAGTATALVPDGSGTTGIAPDTGRVLWSYRIDFEAQTASLGLTLPLDTRFTYASRMPVAWGGLVADAVCVAHDDKPSQTWALRLVDGQPRLAWYTHDCVPVTAEVDKANFVARDGRLYLFDAHGVWDEPQYDGKIDRRPRRQAARFQCRDLATGVLLWSSDALNGRPAGDGEIYQPNHIVFAGDTMVMTDQYGLWFARVSAAGVEVLAKYGQAIQWASHAHSPPVLSNGRLWVRKDDCDLGSGLLQVFGGTGNLICLSVGAD